MGIVDKPKLKVQIQERVVVATFRVAGIHHWPGAPQDLPEAYLVHPHRHEFKVEVGVEVVNSDREVEIINLKNIAIAEFKLLGMENSEGTIHFGAQSCEMLAEVLGIKLATLHDYYVTTVAVMEDDENGAVVHFNTYPSYQTTV